MSTPTKTAIVTGAGTGIGRQAAILLAESGYAVALVSRTRSNLEETAALVREARADAQSLVLPADVGEPDACHGVVQSVIDTWGRLDAVANIAGYAMLGTIENLKPDDWRTVVDVNLTSIMSLTSAAWPTMRRQKAGVIVNVSSMASFDPFPGFALYASAKAAVNMFTLCTAREGAKMGIKAVAVAPGAVETPMLRSMFNTKMIPEDKTLDPVEVAAVIRDCITGARKFENGETIKVASP
ncbi:MAG: SDR family NAD(P)-dependent oxidoreductase [Phycisphaera sp.]|nr:SDR family NAD(P)-dependent oxidoreductase [Phycisphaera sp.]